MNNTSEDVYIEPVKGRNAPDIGPAAVMVSSDADLKAMCGIMNAGNGRRFLMSRMHTAPAGDFPVALAGPYIGSPYAVMLLETLVAWGVRHIVVLGWCGAISPDIKIGDIIVPSSSWIDEGTSFHYGIREKAFPDRELTAIAGAELENAGVRFHAGPVWTTDAVYRETVDRVEQFRNRGGLAVEMECSALYAAAAFRNVRISSLLTVSDILLEGTWTPGFKLSSFRSGRKTACEMMSRICLKINRIKL